jgi:hypothetical protein
MPIELGKTLIVASDKEEHLRQAEKWVDNWNEQFKGNIAKIQGVYMQQQVHTEGSPLRRLWIEVLLYLPTKELEASVALTTKDIFHCTRNEELWIRKLAIEGCNVSPSVVNYRAEYIKTTYERCARCKLQLDISKIAFKCPYYKRPICKTCDYMHGYRPQSVNSFCKTWKVDFDLLKQLKVPIFMYMRAKSLYYEDCIRLVAAYYAERLKLLQEDAKKHPEKLSATQLKEVIAFTLDKFFRVDTITNWIGSLIHRFSGTNDQKEPLAASLEQFYETIKRIPA